MPMNRIKQSSGRISIVSLAADTISSINSFRYRLPVPLANKSQKSSHYLGCRDSSQWNGH
jgi:hypothetical protein